MSYCRIPAICNPGIRALLAACSILWVPACTHQYLDEAEALDIYRDNAPELLELLSGPSDGNGEIDISGLYLTENNSFHSVSLNSASNRLLLRVKQQGNRITAFDSTYQQKLVGYIRNGRIEYYLYPSTMTGNSGLAGTWTVDSEGNLAGQWRTTNYGAVGTWELRKLDVSGIELYTTETGMHEPVRLEQADVLFDRLFSRNDDKNIVFFLHGRGDNFADLFDDRGVPSVEAYSDTRFVVMSWLSWADISVRPYNHAIAGANGIAEFLYTFENYRSRFADKIGDRKITLMAHSMGNIPLAAFLKYRYEPGDLQAGLFDSIIFSSADLPFENHSQWIEKCDFSKQIFVTQHRRDYILRISRYLFSPEDKSDSFKLGIGLDPEEADYYEQLANNASYLDLTDLTFTGHKHFVRKSALPLFRELLNARKIGYPDPSIGLYRKSDRHPVFFFHSSEPEPVEDLPDS